MPSKISDPEIVSLWGLTSKTFDWINFLWQFHVTLTVVVIGWLFSGDKPLSVQQKSVVTVIYSLACGMNLAALIRCYMILFPALRQLKAATKDLENYNEDFKQLFQKGLPGKYHWTGGLILHLTSYLIVCYCIWFLVKA